MKEYPSILSSNGNNFINFDAHVFDKIDGSNLRFEWSKKQGWYKFGTRRRLFDESDEVFGVAINLFNNNLANKLEKMAKDNGWISVVFYAEFWGVNSFAGTHYPEDEKFLSVFDIAPHKKGILGPIEFLKLTDKYSIETPKYLGVINWTRGFIERVRNNELEGVTYEGVIGKVGEGHKLIMRKAKTQAWIDAVLARYGDKAKDYL